MSGGKSIITPELVKRFNEDGAVVVRGVFSSYWVEVVQRGIQRNLQEPSKYAEWLKVSESYVKYKNKISSKFHHFIQMCVYIHTHLLGKLHYYVWLIHFIDL